MEIRYLGHSAFWVQDPNTSILFDPFLNGNPRGAAKADDLNPNYIIVTHGHADHVGDTVAIAKRTGATVISTFELASDLESKGAATRPMHLGGKAAFPFGYVRCTPAFHGSGIPGGHAAGFMVRMGGKTIYHAGDTALFSDMKLLGELESIDVALLPIGDNFTMGPDDALLAAQFLRARAYIPMHYKTWPLIDVDPYAWQARARDRGLNVVVLEPGQSQEF